MKHLTIIGAGAWGTALAYIFSDDFPVVICTRNQDAVDKINRFGKNPRYSGDRVLTNISAMTNLTEALQDTEVIINALPAYAIYDVFEKIKPLIVNETIIINTSKGADLTSHEFPHQIITKLLPHISYFSFSGPSFAAGLLENNPTIITIAGKEKSLLEEIITAMRKAQIYPIFSEDIMGVEWGGIYKNVVAIATGLSAGMGYGENTHALLFTKGFAEMIASGTALGAKQETFLFPSGVGDLMLSTSSMKSRNFSFGYHLAKEQNTEKIFTELSGIAEGYYTLKSLSFLKNKYRFTTPLADMLQQIIFEKTPPQKAFSEFLQTL